MYNLKYFLPINALKSKLDTTESKLSLKAKVSRLSFRAAIKGPENNLSLNTLGQISEALDRDMLIAYTTENTNTDYSTLGISMMIQRDGFDSWKIHLMNFVDEFRRSLDPRLILLQPVQDLDQKLKSLIASTVLYVCEEAQIHSPTWAVKKHVLSEPWFVANSEALKVMSLLESPTQYRKNNIFVLSNFLTRH